MPTWTEAQSNAIESRGGTVLVSAAAGSGKTAVLVERIIQRLTDPDNPIRADKLLVVTFTRAAAAEMKERIDKALRERIKENPSDVALRRQQMLLPQAIISTVDSFCSKLVREFFYKLDIQSDFTIMDDKVQSELINQALSQTMDEYFSSEDTMLADYFSEDKNDRKFYDLILKLYNYTSCHMFPERWLQSVQSLYNPELPAGETVWGKRIIEYARDEAMHYLEVLRNLERALCENPVLLEKRTDPISELTNVFERLIEALNSGDWNSISAVFDNLSFMKLPAVRGMKEDSLKIRADKIIKDAREVLTNDMKKIFCDTEDVIRSEINAMIPVIVSLDKLVARFAEIYASLKREKNSADYSDVEHMALSLLIEKTEDGYRRTELAESLSERFDEIMIDEYQDTNEVQDAIFKSLSKDDRNRFMVGDVKQSIYGFRMAMPEIFLDYKHSFAPFTDKYHDYPALINLDRNFRSGKDVIDTVNYFFGLLMNSETGDIDYTGSEELVFGRPDIESTEATETFIDFVVMDNDMSDVEAESKHIAELVRDTLSSGLTVADNGVERPVEYRDICILLRKYNQYAQNYAEVLNSCGVPVDAEINDRFFERPEILSFVSYLQVIDNPDQDIPLVSLLLSPIYGFTADDLAELRVNDRKTSIYNSILRSKDEKYDLFLADMEKLRRIAAVMPAGEFITYLFDSTGYLDMVRAMGDGDAAVANLRKLREYATSFEKQGYIGIQGFVRIINRLKAGKEDLKAAVCENNENAVKLMSIHASKGLQYPVVIIAGCSKQFHRETSDVVLDMNLGVGVRLRDTERGLAFSNIIRDSILLENARKDLSEELRVLYVAMTRAEKKLIMVGAVKKLDSGISAFVTDEPRFSPFAVSQANSYTDWMRMCALRHPCAEEFRKEIGFEENCVIFGAPSMKIRICEVPEIIIEQEKENELCTEIDRELLSSIKETSSFVYPHAGLGEIPTKVTASSLSESTYVQRNLPRPSFMGEKGLSPSERGTAFHAYLQLCDFKTASVDPLSELDRLLSDNYITSRQADAIDINLVNKFFGSELGKMILTADKVYKEWQFSVNIPASSLPMEVVPEYDDTPVFMQGAIDCIFERDSKLYIVDFKTDRVKNADELAVKYKVQLGLYKQALEMIMEKEVSECHVFSLRLGTSALVEF